MRRMLDPKEAGGNIYCHQIKLTDTPDNMITLDYFSNSDIPFTRSSFKTKLGSNHLGCSGAISSRTSGTKVKYIAAYLYVSSDSYLSCYAINLDNGNYEYVDLSSYNFYDNVVPA